MAQLMPLSLDSVKSILVLPFWYQLTRLVPDKGCVCVCVFVQDGFALPDDNENGEAAEYDEEY